SGLLNGEGQAAAESRDSKTELPVGREDFLITPSVPTGYRSVWAQYSVLARDEEARARYQEVLKAAGVPTAIYYPRPLHLRGPLPPSGTDRALFP
ncbi:MAG TPA: hypothetical protein P5244_15125, partial [Syntrophales bacterium]|nr:hypothetical protein [Syntrophales bacterium]